MKKLIVSITMLIIAFVSTSGFGNLVEELNKDKNIGLEMPSKIAVEVIIIVIGFALILSGMRKVSFIARLGISVLLIVQVGIVLNYTEIGEALIELLNISNPKDIFKPK